MAAGRVHVMMVAAVRASRDVRCAVRARRLLNIDPLRRLGANINVPAGQDVRKHNWFVNEVVNKQKFDFAALEAKKYPAPFVPKIRSPTDASAFDPYGEDDGKLNYPEEVRDREKSAGFADEWV
jgi:hypothetical protein